MSAKQENDKYSANAISKSMHLECLLPGCGEYALLLSFAVIQMYNNSNNAANPAFEGDRKQLVNECKFMENIPLFHDEIRRFGSLEIFIEHPLIKRAKEFANASEDKKLAEINRVMAIANREFVSRSLRGS